MNMGDDAARVSNVEGPRSAVNMDGSAGSVSHAEGPRSAVNMDGSAASASHAEGPRPVKLDVPLSLLSLHASVLLS